MAQQTPNQNPPQEPFIPPRYLLVIAALGFIAAALGTTLAGWAMTLQLWWGSRHMGEAARFDDRLRARLPRTVAASAVMGLFLWGAAQGLAQNLAAPGERYGALALLVLGGMAVYAAAAWGFGAFRLADFRGGAPRRDQR